MDKGRVAIVVASHALLYPLDKCISSHAALCSSPRDLIVVDNGSGGNVAACAREFEPECTLLEREDNGFFCGGYNTGIQHAIDEGYEYVLIVNADTEVVNSDYVRALVDVADAEPTCAFIGPMVFNGDRDTIQNTILTFPWYWRYLVQWFSSRLSRTNRSAEAQEKTTVEFLNGVCVLCRVQALREIGLMDETMGGYVEDADWSFRARKLGWASLFVPVPSILHQQETAEYHHYSMKSFMLRRNHVYWHFKNRRYIQAFGFFTTPLLLALARALLASITGNEANSHWRYVRKFQATGMGILLNRPIGPWFGPPLGKYE